MIEAPQATMHTHLLVRVEKYDLAIPISAIISIHEAPVVVAVPCAQPGIAGGIQFQGMALPVFDLRRSLRLNPRPVAYSDRLVLVDTGERIVALIVDEVKESVALERDIQSGLDTLFGDSLVNENVIAGMACAPKLCAVINPAGLLLPDIWDSEPTLTMFEQPLDESDPLWARTVALAQIPKPMYGIGVEAALFQIAGQRFGVPLPTIVEFFNDAAHSPIPLRSSIAVSLLNRRGEAVMLFDPRPILGLPPAPLPARVDGLVLSGDRCRMALPLDKMEGLGMLPRSDASLKPNRFCISVHPSEQGAVLLLDVPAFLGHAQSAFGDRAPGNGPKGPLLHNKHELLHHEHELLHNEHMRIR